MLAFMVLWWWTACIPWVGVVVDSSDTGPVTDSGPVPLVVGELQQGDLVVTEIMNQPLEMPRYVEITVPGRRAIDLSGVAIISGTGSFVIRPGVVLNPQEHAVFGPEGLGPSNQTWGAGGPELPVPAGRVALQAGKVLLDAVAWDQASDWPSADGVALELSASRTDHVSNDDPASWCLSTVKIPNETKGTPQNYGSPQVGNGECPR